MTFRFGFSKSGTACIIAVFAGFGMATSSPGGTATVACTAASGSALPLGFEAEFCAVLDEEIARNRPSGAAPAHIDVDLSRAGEFAITARVTVRSGGGTHHQEFTLSVKDSTLQPSIAKVIVFPVLQLLE